MERGGERSSTGREERERKRGRGERERKRQARVGRGEQKRAEESLPRPPGCLELVQQRDCGNKPHSHSRQDRVTQPSTGMTRS